MGLPLTPMTIGTSFGSAPNESKVGLVDHNTVGQGAGAVRAAFDSLKADGVRMAVVDATNEADLMTIGAAANEMAMVTGGSGIAIGLPNNFKIADGAADQLPKVEGLSAVISGSCSRATQGQVANFMRNHPAFQIEPLKLAAGQDMAAAALEWALQKLRMDRSLFIRRINLAKCRPQAEIAKQPAIWWSRHCTGCRRFVEGRS